MKSEEISAASEDGLLREAESFGDVLELVRSWDVVPAELIDGRTWEALKRRDGALRATAAAFPFGFKMPLHDGRPKVDLGISILGGSRTAAAIEEAERHQDTAPHITGIACLLREMDRKESALRQITDWELMLEYDIDAEQPDAGSDPAILLGSIGRMLWGDGHSMRFADIAVLLRAMAEATRQEPDAAVQRQVERVYRALTPETRIETLGVYPALDGMIRVELNGFRTAPDVLAFLERVGWHTRHMPFADSLRHLEARGAFHHLGIHADVRADGLEPEFGINLANVDKKPQDGRYWLDKASNWAELIAALGEHGLAVPEKLSALSRWPGARIVSGRFGAFVLLRGISHVELVTTGDRFEYAKAYAYMFLRSMPQDVWALARLST